MTKPSHADSDNTVSAAKNWWPLIHRVTSIIALVVIGGIAWASLRSQLPQQGVAKVEREPEAQTSTDDAQDLETTAVPTRIEPVDNPEAQSPESNSPVAKLSPEAPIAITPPAAAEVQPEPNAPEPNVPETSEQSTTEDKPSTATVPEELGPAPKFYDADVAQLTFNKTCSQCHKTARVEKFDFKDRAGVEAILTRMSAKMEKKGLAFNDKQRAFLQHYLESTFLK